MDRNYNGKKITGYTGYLSGEALNKLNGSTQLVVQCFTIYLTWEPNWRKVSSRLASLANG